MKLTIPKLRPVYVMHRHHATNLHNDLRLEFGGVLKSWALPKNPSKASTKKILAIATPDHPLTYATFSGMISEGSYGAGKVEIWDKGSFDLIEKTSKKIVVHIKGRKLKGQYVLVKFDKAGPKHWLFFKK